MQVSSQDWWRADVIEWGDALRADPWLLVLDVLLLGFFLYQWYQGYRATGWKIDFWTVTVFIRFIFPILVMYPFGGAWRNYISTAVRQTYVRNYVDEAFLVSALGLMAVYAGRWLYQRTYPHRTFTALLRPVEELMANNIRSWLATGGLLFVLGLLLLFVIQTQITTGYLFNPRRYFQFNGALRPLYNAMLALYPLALVFVGIRAFQYRRRADLLLVVVLFLCVPFLGVRSVIIQPVLTLISFFAFANYRRFRLRWLALVLAGLSVAVIALMELRQIDEGRRSNTFVDNLLYGSTFSDTRDFGWVMAHWDGEYLYGKTYAAGLIGFIPRSLSEFRDRWSLGVYTTRLTGFDVRFHPGLRPGSFGEMYFNFGAPGVALLGLLFGYVLAHADRSIRRDIEVRGDVVRAYTRTLPVQFVYCFCLSTGFPAFYALVLFMVALAVFRQTLVSQKPAVA